ncbi:MULTISPECIES: hypothetical protein [Massilia]|uniref:TetR family transcriptional regulator n=1 Tax=Massilia haematophila TaxID=457923 RepID=A0ABV7PIH4_9BURK|nr:hypothetical protein [Massilia timonae]
MTNQKPSKVSDEARAKIKAAATRLLAGKPIVSSSHELTATNLAVEAGIGRATLNRAIDLRDEFFANVKQLQTNAAASHPQVVADRLRDELANVEDRYREEIRSLRALNEKLANQVQVLTLLLQRHENQAHRAGGARENLVSTNVHLIESAKGG